MTPLEILTATINGAPTPRIPIFCNLLDQGADELGMSQQEYYSKGEHVAAGQLKLRARYGYDNVWSLFFVGKEAQLLGAKEILYANDGAPNVTDFVIKTYDDIAKFTVPDDITSHPIWAEIASCLKILKAEVGDHHPICAYLTASTTLPVLLMGMEKWMELLLTGPVDLRDELLRKCSDFFQKEIAAYREAGANVLLYTSPFGTPYFVGMKRFKEFSLPWMRRDLTPGGIDNIVYYCGTAPLNQAILPMMRDLGITSFYISPLDDLFEAKAIIGKQGLTCGVIDDIKMIHWLPGQTREEVRRICQTGMVGRHFLFGTGLMPQAIPRKNIHAMIDAAFEFGYYP